MAKSTVHQALASLQFKFQAKIREVGQLKKLLGASDAVNPEVQRLRLRNDNLSNELLKTTRELNLAEFEVCQGHAAYKRLSSHVKDVDGVVKELRSNLSNWKSFSGVAFVLGLGVGVLSTLAYIAQTTPL